MVTADCTLTGMLSTCPVIVVTCTRIGGVAELEPGSACTNVTPAMPPLMTILGTIVPPDTSAELPVVRSRA